MVDERLTRWTQPITFRFQRKRSNRRDLIIHCQEMVRWWLNSINIETGSRVFFRCLFSIGWSSPTVDETPFVVAEEPFEVALGVGGGGGVGVGVDGGDGEASRRRPVGAAGREASQTHFLFLFRFFFWKFLGFFFADPVVIESSCGQPSSTVQPMIAKGRG